jgi:large subunit ribosomal protein L22
MKTAGSYFPNKTNERPGRPSADLDVVATRAQARYVRMSASKVRVVLDLIRGETVQRAGEILQFTERDSAEVVGKCLASAVANAVNNDGQSVGELHVLACYADEGPTLKRWRPRARGRATRIRKRTTHVTVIVAPLPAERLAIVQAREAARSTARSGRTTRSAAEARRRRVARSRGEEASALSAGGTAPSEAPPESGDVETVFADGPFGPGSMAPPEDGSVPAGYEIKGNEDSMLYHEPGSRSYGATKAEVFFATAEDAERAGFSLPPSARDVEDERDDADDGDDVDEGAAEGAAGEDDRSNDDEDKEA